MQAFFAFDNQSPAVDPGFRTLTRTWLDPESWIDYAPGWLSGSDSVFRAVLDLQAGASARAACS